MNNKWHAYNESDTVFVFIHGFLSDSNECWRNKSGDAYFPELINSEEFDNPSVFLAGYHTGAFEDNFDINQCAMQLQRNLSLQIEGKRAPLDFKRIIFICHSLGGIVSRILFCKIFNFLKGKKIGFALIASPSLGSSYADNLAFFSTLFGNEVAKQLKNSNELLMKLDKDFIELINSCSDFELTGVEACEQYGPVRFKWFPFFKLKPIVDSVSGSRYFNEKHIIPKTDHFSIAKPESKESEIVKFLLFYYKNNFNQKNELKNFNLKKFVQVKSDPLFDIYSPEHYEFYSTRKIDQKIEKLLNYKSIWIHGASGVGKTSIAKFAANKFCTKPCEIHLGHLDLTQGDNQLLIEILSTIDPDGNIETTKGLHQKLVRTISENSVDNVYLLFDEVPIKDSISNENFIVFISNLLDAVRQTKKYNVRFIVCSINEPEEMYLTDKIKERFEIIEVGLWSQNELNKLTTIIINELGQIEIDRSSLLRSSKGLPRHLKNNIKEIFLEKV